MVSEMYRKNIVDNNQLTEHKSDIFAADRAKFNTNLYNKKIKSLRKQDVSLEDFNLIQEKLIKSLSEIEEESLNGKNYIFLKLFNDYKYLDSFGYGLILVIFSMLRFFSFKMIDLNFLFLSKKDKILLKAFKKLGYEVNLISIELNSVAIGW